MSMGAGAQCVLVLLAQFPRRLADASGALLGERMGERFVEHGPVYYVLALVLAGGCGALGGWLLSRLGRDRRRQRRTWVFPVCGALAAAAVLAETVDQLATSWLVIPRATLPKPSDRAWNSTPEVLERARLACVSPRHRALALATLERHLAAVFCFGQHKGWSERERAFADLVRTNAARGVAGPLASMAGSTGWNLLEAQARLCREDWQWVGPLMRGDFDQATRGFPSRSHPFWDRFSGRKIWLLTATGRFAEAARSLPQRWVPEQCRSAGLSHGCPALARLRDCWRAYLEARAGAGDARERLMARAALPPGPQRTPMASDDECLLLAADLAHGEERRALLVPWWSSPQPTRDALDWRRGLSLGLLLDMEESREEPPALSRELDASPSAAVEWGRAVAPPFTVIHEHLLATLDGRSELSPARRLLRAELRIHRAVWLATVGEVDAALVQARAALEDWSIARQRPSFVSSMQWVNFNDRIMVKSPVPLDTFIDEGRSWFVVLALRAGKLGLAQSFLAELDAECARQLAPMVDFFRGHARHAIDAWGASTVYGPSMYADCWQAAFRDGSCTDFPVIWSTPYTGRPQPGRARASAQMLVADYVQGGFFGNPNGDCLDVYKLEQIVRALGAADLYPELTRGAQSHRQLWAYRDRVVPLLLLGSWWGECAAE
jgi:hypothetical protein